MHACMYACMYACMFACMYVCMFACMYVCMNVCMYDVCINVCNHRYKYIYIHTSGPTYTVPMCMFSLLSSIYRIPPCVAKGASKLPLNQVHSHFHVGGSLNLST